MNTYDRFTLWCVASSFLLLCTNQIIAHDGAHDQSTVAARSWELTDGTHIHGSFIGADDSHLRVLANDGHVLTIELNKLSLRSRHWVASKQLEIDELNHRPAIRLVSQAAQSSGSSETRPAIADSFKAFEKSVKVRWDSEFLFVESNGVPDHPMMVGITAWQQQVPLPQKYIGDNAWRIPLHPIPAKTPVSAKGRFLRGAIALAINGIPIFNPLNNRGDDAYLFGELDEFGGHCGRADDYHYHIAPVHLEKVVGKGQPIAYALDGYPIYGYQDPNAADFQMLDWLNGHKDAQGNYHYHATEKYPYLNGGFYGQVVEREGQVDPQPRAEPVRPALPPMRGAKITKFQQAGPTATLTYEVDGRPGTVRYTQNENGSVDFVFTDPSGRTNKETYSQRRRPGQGGAGGPNRDPKSPRNEPGGNAPGRSEPRDNSKPGPGGKPRDVTSQEKPEPPVAGKPATALQLSSQSIDQRGMLSIECTCDGKKESPAIAWKNLPAGTKSIAISLWHTAPDREKSYWLVYNIPVGADGLPQNSKRLGTLGLNDRKRPEYDPMCSKGPGIKTYHVTVYAMSQSLEVRPDQMDRGRLLEEAKKHSLAQSTLDFQYERK